jgi:hypothetical protein
VRLYGDESRGDGDGGRGDGGEEDEDGDDVDDNKRSDKRSDKRGERGGSDDGRGGARAAESSGRRRRRSSGGSGRHDNDGRRDAKGGARRSRRDRADGAEPSQGAGSGGAPSQSDRSSVQFEVQLLTLSEVPPRAKLHVGGVVMARSVKYLGRVKTSKLDLETRDTWWIELREEVRLPAHWIQLGLASWEERREVVCLKSYVSVLYALSSSRCLRPSLFCFVLFVAVPPNRCAPTRKASAAPTSWATPKRAPSTTTCASSPARAPPPR